MSVITSLEFQRNIGLYQDKALSEPVKITKHGRERLVLISTEEYTLLLKRARHALPVTKLDDSTLQSLAQTSMSSEHNHLNSELPSES